MIIYENTIRTAFKSNQKIKSTAYKVQKSLSKHFLHNSTRFQFLLKNYFRTLCQLFQFCCFLAMLEFWKIRNKPIYRKTE